MSLRLHLNGTNLSQGPWKKARCPRFSGTFSGAWPAARGGGSSLPETRFLPRARSAVGPSKGLRPGCRRGARARAGPWELQTGEQATARSLHDAPASRATSVTAARGPADLRGGGAGGLCGKRCRFPYKTEQAPPSRHTKADPAQEGAAGSFMPPRQPSDAGQRGPGKGGRAMDQRCAPKTPAGQRGEELPAALTQAPGSTGGPATCGRSGCPPGR